MHLRRSCVRPALTAILLAMTTGTHAQSVFGTLEIDSWNVCSSNLAAFCQSAGLPFALTSMNGVAGPLLRAPNLTGIHVQRPIRLYLLLDARAKNPIPTTVAALPLADNGAAYLDSLRNAFNTETQNGGITLFSNPKTYAHEQRLAVLVTNGVALTGETADDVTATALAVQNKRVPMCEKLPADIRLCLDMPQLLPLLAQGSDTVRHQMTQLPPAAKPGMPDPAKIVGGELDAALAIARQVRQLSIGVKADAANLTLLSSLEPVPGSTLAAVLREQRPPSERYTRLLPANTLFGVVGGGMSGLHVLLKPYAESIAQFYEGMPGMSVNGIAMRDLLLQGAAIYTGDYAIGLLPDVRSNGVVFAEIIAVSDADKARKLMRDGIALTEKSDTNAPLGLCVKMRPARTYAGSEIQAFCYQMTPNPAAQQDPAPPPVMTIMSYLTNCTCEQTLVGKDMVVSFGRAGAIDQVIDRVRLGGDAQFYRNARAMFADNSAAQPNEISHMELTAAISMLLKLLPGDLGSRLPALPPGKGLGTIEICHGNSMVSMLRITTPEIRSLVQAGSALMSGNMPAGKDDADAMAPPRKRHAASVRPTAPTAPVSPTAPAEE